MKIGETDFRAVNPVVSETDLNDIYKRRKEAALTADAEEAIQKFEEAKQDATKSTFDMMDRHHEIVKKSQELNKQLAKKRALEHQTQKQVDERREIMAEVAIRNAERRDLLELERLKQWTEN